MVGRRRAAFSSAAATGANALIVALQSILLLPLFLRWIGKALYGAWAGTGDILLWIQAFDLGLPNLMAQRIAAAHGREDEASAGRWLATGLVVLAVAAGILIALSLGIAYQLPRMFGNLPEAERNQLSHAFALAAVASSLVMVNNGALVYGRAIQRPAFLNSVMTVSAILNLAVTFFFLSRGAGLFAIAYGVLARSGLQTVAGVGFLAAQMRRGLAPHFRFDREVFREAMKLMPSTLLGGLAYAALNQSELLILNLTAGEVAAASFLTLRRLSELTRAIGDSIALGSYPSFAHLVSSQSVERASEVLDELNGLRIAVCVILTAPYLAINSSFVSVWVHGQVRPDGWITIAVAVQTLVIGGAFLSNYLYRAAGGVLEGSLFLAAEAVIRVTVMYVLSRFMGPIGIPLGAIATALPAWILTLRLLRKRLGVPLTPPAKSQLLWVVRGTVLALSAAFGYFVVRPQWKFVVAAGFGSLILALAIALATEPSMARFRNRLVPAKSA